MTIINEKIYIGSVDAPTLSFNQNNIEDIVCNNSVNLIGDELASDVLEASIFFDDAEKVLESTAYATPVFYFSNDALVGKYYISQIERKGLKRYLIRATSLIGLIEKEQFYGGFYSGKTFSNIVDDILFTNGVNLTKYKLYTPIGYTTGSYYASTKVWFGEPSYEGRKNHIHLEFIYRGDYRSLTNATNTTILGRSPYSVQVTSALSNGGNPTCAITASYGGSSHYLGYWSSDPGYKMFGVGSKFVIDVDPIAGTGYIGCDYINPDTSATGHLQTSWTFTESTSTSTIYMTCAFGGTDSYGNPSTYQSAKLQWEIYRVYDGTGALIIDGMFGTNEAGTVNYVANAATGYVVSTTSFEPYGSSYATIADFARIERDQALAESIVYNESVEDIPVTGWIKTGTRREALHQLLFAENVSMIKSDDGKIIFTKISSGQDASISDDNVYDDSSEKSMSVAKKINITEHSYETSNVSSEKIFDNSSSITPSGQYIALFDKAPIFGTPVGNGITIIAHNCNAALVTGKGTITGTPYVHSKNVIEYTGNSSDGVDVSVSDVGLITSINSDSVMSKLKAYYSGTLKRIINSIIFNGERCGLKYAFKTMFSENNTAYLVKLNAQTSSFVKAKCEFVSGFIPQSSSGYTDFEIVTSGNTWTIPSEIRSQTYPSIRLNLIGKGQNGTAGSNGTAGQRGSSGSGALPGGAGGTGGAGGSGGNGGNIYSITVDVTNINSIAVSSSGSNIIVQTYNDGGTLVNTYSSGTGVSSASGFMNIFSGIYYARKGKDGIAGGDGGQGGYVSLSSGNLVIIKGASGEDAGNYQGGESFNCVVETVSAEYGTAFYYHSYGGGGGAAYGANGGNAYSTQSVVGITTYGGNGANALPTAEVYTEYGSGGFGGNGGGGGGGAGTNTSAFPYESGVSYETYYYLAGGYGTGSSGTSGIDGCVIIYY